MESQGSEKHNKPSSIFPRTAGHGKQQVGKEYHSEGALHVVPDVCLHQQREATEELF